MYESGSLPAHLGAEKQGPKALPKSAFGSATVPTELTVYERPSYIFVNTTGSFHFMNSTSSSIGKLDANGTYDFGIRVNTVSQGPIRLDINPYAWSGSAEIGGKSFPVGSVTFIYQGGL